MKAIYFLIGFPKTATTFLQREVFNKLKTVQYLKNFEGETAEDILLKMIYNPLTDEEALEIRRKALDGANSERIIYVQENLATGAFGYFLKDLQERKVVLENIQKIFFSDKIKIILGIREPYDIIRSFYLLYLHKGGYLLFEKFLKLINGKCFEECQGPFFELFEYGPYIGLIKQIFGDDNLCVYNFEDLSKGPRNFVRHILRFLNEDEGIDVYHRVHNRGYGVLEVKCSRFLNRFLRSSQNKEGLIPQIKIPGFGIINHRRFFQSRYFPKIFYSRFDLSKEWQDKIKARYQNFRPQT